jgi:CRISPR-associated protein Csm2
MMRYDQPGGAPKARGAGAKENEYEAALVRAFGQGYADRILSPRKPDYNKYLEEVKAYMEDKATSITASQLRNFYAHMKRVRRHEDLYAVRPLLAYASGRAKDDDKSARLREVLYLLDALIRKVDSPDKLREFQGFFEALVAYHKYFGGNE